MHKQFLLILLLCVLSPGLISAQGMVDRYTFSNAELAIKEGDLATYKRLKARLGDYPLVPYLEYQLLRDRISRVRPSDIRAYLETYPSTPTANRLREAWLDRLVKEKRWAEFLAFYDAEDASVIRRCQHLRALINTGQSKKAFAATPEIWLYGKSRPKACDPPIASWRKAGNLTTELVWDRIVLAMEARSLDLAKYLKRFLPAADRATFDFMLKVHTDPGTWLPTLERRRDNVVNKDILAHGIRRLAGGDPGGAAEIWKQNRSRYDFTSEEACNVDARLAIALEDETDPRAYAFFLELEPCDNRPRLLESRVRAALLHRDWPRVEGWIEALPDKMQVEERWLYWKARAWEAQGREAQARPLYEIAAKERTYYGFLAADKIGADYRSDHKKIDAGNEVLAQVSQLPGMQRMRELYALDRFVDARREWLVLIPELDRPQLLAASQIFDEWGWLDRAIFTAARAGYWDDLELRFPLEHAEIVFEYAKKRNLDPSWVFGVLRQESAFILDARSTAGALGLMQLLPATARLVAREKGLPRPTQSTLITADTNIALGTGYLRMMLDDLYQEEVLATAAYNAGPHRVTRWLEGETLPVDLWVEMIPFKETRTYVQRVLAYAIIYDGRLGNPTRRLSERMQSTRPGA